MEPKQDASEVGQVVPEREYQQAAQLAQLAVQLRGDSKEEPETFLNAARKLLNAARDLLEPKRDPIDAAYDEFLSTGEKEELATLLEVCEEPISTGFLFFSGSKAGKAEIQSVKRIGLAASGVVVWCPKDDPNYSPEFGQWEAIELDNFLFKGLLKRCHEAFIREYPNSKMSLKTYRAKWRELIESGADISDGCFLFLFSIRYPNVYAAYKRAAKFHLTLIEKSCEEKRQAAEKRNSPPRNKDGQFTKRKP